MDPVLGWGLCHSGLGSNLDLRLGFSRGQKGDLALWAEPKGSTVNQH